MRFILTVVTQDAIKRGCVLGTIPELPQRMFLDLVDNSRVVRVVKIRQDEDLGFVSDSSGGCGSSGDDYTCQDWLTQLQFARDPTEVDIVLHWNSRAVRTDHQAGVPKVASIGWRVIAARDIAAGSGLRVWFSDESVLVLGLPVLRLVNICGPGHYQCHMCSFKAANPNVLKCHLLTVPHTNPVSQLSRPAPRPPSSQHRLQSVSTNSVGKVHQCLFCGKLYSRKYGLKIHIRTHTGYKPLACKICHRPFGDPSNLNKHTRLHMQAPTHFLCPLCGKTLLRKRDLDRHIKIKHNDDLDSDNFSSVQNS